MHWYRGAWLLSVVGKPYVNRNLYLFLGGEYDEASGWSRIEFLTMEGDGKGDVVPSTLKLQSDCVR
jgi:hypothetical protein